jgi:hypothetical protein
MAKVIILGCGPAGLAAAKAAADAGCETLIISSTDKPSKLHGCQYLHAPVPGYEDVPSVRVRYRLVGTPEQYRTKVYGKEWTGKVSPEDFAGEHMAWDIRLTYKLMWRDLIESLIVGLVMRRVIHGSIPYVRSLKPDLIVSTIPAMALCKVPAVHRFTSYVIFANGTSEVADLPEDSVVCDGTEAHPWYRISSVFGYRTTEWSSAGRVPAHAESTPVIKPLWTDCDCHPEVLRTGRYGAWEKARLVHEVYPAVSTALAALASLEPSPDLIRGIERVTGEHYEGRGKWRM